MKDWEVSEIRVCDVKFLENQYKSYNENKIKPRGQRLKEEG